MKLKLHELTMHFTKGGNEVEVVVTCANPKVADEVARVVEDIPRDHGIVTRCTKIDLETSAAAFPRFGDTFKSEIEKGKK